MGSGVTATCCIARLEQVSLGGLEASWSANYTVSVILQSLSVGLVHSYRNMASCFKCRRSHALSIHNLFFPVLQSWYNAILKLTSSSESHVTLSNAFCLATRARAECYRFILDRVCHCSMNQSQRLRFMKCQVYLT